MGRWGGMLAAIVALGALAACSGDTSGLGQASGEPAGDGSVAAAEQGEQLDKADADRLETQLKATPNDANAREQLVGYYFIAQATQIQRPGAGVDPNGAFVAHDRHVIWLIKNAPGIDLLSTTVGLVQPAPDAAGYASAKAAWTQAAGDKAPSKVKGNAGIFFAQTGDPLAIVLLTAAEAGDGQNPDWPSALADLYVSRAKGSPFGSPGAQSAAASAVGELEKAWNLSGSSNRDPRLSQLAKLAVVAGQDDKAVQYATVLLNTFKASSDQSPLTVGGPIHDGNMVLGQVALRKGDRSGAEQYLLKAGATPGSPLLDQFGPNFSLARDLLGAGSKDVVLRYFDEVSKFWDDPKLAAWRSQVVAGKVPDFGDNLWN